MAGKRKGERREVAEIQWALGGPVVLGVQLAAEALGYLAQATSVHPLAVLILSVQGNVGSDPVAGAAGRLAPVIDRGEALKKSVGAVGGVHGLEAKEERLAPLEKTIQAGRPHGGASVTIVYTTDSAFSCSFLAASASLKSTQMMAGTLVIAHDHMACRLSQSSLQ